MALHIKEVTYKEMCDAGRFDARYFFLQDAIEKYEENPEVQLVDLGNPELLLEITDGEHAGQTFVKEGVRFIKNSGVKDFDISLFDGFFISQKKHRFLARSAVKSKDILFTTIGHLGSSAIVPENFGEANINQNLVRMRINENEINPYYLAAFLNCSFVRAQIDCLFTGNIQSILTYPKIKKIKIIKASKEFQNQIGVWYKDAMKCSELALKKVQDIKDELREKLGLNKIHIVTEQEYSISNITIKNKLWTPKYYFPKYVSMLEYFKHNFNCVKMEDLVEYYSGDEVGSESYNSYLDKKETDVPFIRTSDIYNYQVDICPDNFVDYTKFEELNQDIRKGDILFSNDGKIGMLAMITGDEPLVVQSHINIIKVKSPIVTAEYLYAMLMLDEVNAYQCDKCTVVQSTIPTLASRFDEFIIPILEDKIIEQVTMMMQEVNVLFERKKNTIKKIQKSIEIMLVEMNGGN